MRSCSIFYKKICCIYTAFGVSQTPNKIPYKEELGKTLDYNNALEKAPSPLVHNMELRTKLPKEIIYIKEKYLYKAKY